MVTDILGVKKYPRSRAISTFISRVLLAECEGDFSKESTIRTDLSVFLKTSGTIPAHLDWERVISQNNEIRLEQLAKNQRLERQGIQVSKPSRQTILFTHNLAHLNYPDDALPDCSVCEWCPLENADDNIAHQLMGFNPADYEEESE